MNQIKQILGQVVAEGDDDTSINGEPATNSSKWIFDIVQESPVLKIALVSKYNHRKIEMVGCSLTPMSLTFYDEKVFFEEGEEKGDLTFTKGGEGAAHYRVVADIIHSSSR